jgi:hypothetical protein
MTFYSFAIFSQFQIFRNANVTLGKKLCKMGDWTFQAFNHRDQPYLTVFTKFSSYSATEFYTPLTLGGPTKGKGEKAMKI